MGCPKQYLRPAEERGLTIATFDAAGNVLETASSEALVTVNVLPNRRRELSFRTTRSFAQIGVFINAAAAVISDVNVYSAFADEGGLLQVTSPGPLLVVLTSFAVRRAADAAATVSWATASEYNSAYFVVERTTDPQAGFAAVGQVAAAGTSAGSHTYSLRDAAPTRATSYYRLRQVDLNGTETFSPMVALAGTGAATSGFALYLNPAQAGTVLLGLSTRRPRAPPLSFIPPLARKSGGRPCALARPPRSRPRGCPPASTTPCYATRAARRWAPSGSCLRTDSGSVAGCRALIEVFKRPLA
ncbi:hypothetical protein [Hymenobacter cheonanensis]|uniref:hypothetical protein n=1 Tax=Hymenobacter sp. CA2-7 TaxID=3063993 RepID=UPI002713AABA|nr:hypothetical protein [Hymenobacter sp. CA2-7]MDO7886262.1 hypothetical protein [Hymenobacter sp. CA2-7]